MPLKLRRFFTSVLISLFAIIGATYAQTTPPQANPSPTAPASPLTSVEKQPTSAEVMRDRISKAKAYIAVRNYNAAIFELENIRRETSDQSVNAVANVLLMNSYLEQGDHKRAQNFLNEFFNSYKSNSAAGNMYYTSVAAQVIKGARSQVERYRALGLNPSDRNLPLEAVNDIERMREALELVISQAKELGADKNKVGAAMALLEEATNSRSMIARDDYDARRWRDELGDSREQMASSRSVVINAVDGTTVAGPVQQGTVAMNQPTTTVANPPASNVPVSNPPVSNPPVQQVLKPVTQQQDTTAKPSDKVVASNNAPVTDMPRPRVADSKPVEVAKPNTQTEEPRESKKQDVIYQKPNGQSEAPTPNAATEEPRESKKQDVIYQKPNVATETQKAVETPTQTVAAPTQAVASNSEGSSPMDVGSLISYATKQQAPVYPPAAKSMRTSGVVKVEVTINETGDVSEVHTTTGPGLLQTAAKDAIRKWKFKPFVRDGQPVKAVGFINFNFSL
ncbi:MAG TPA: TonB family protein [Pyrinomonadaceae bacterium]|nr:TonB family protein [Pyrinomonadaceae bacterium]